MAGMIRQQWSFVRPTEELESDSGKIAALVTKAINLGTQRAIETRAIVTAEQSKVREVDPVVDLGAGVGGWLTMPLAAIGGLYSCICTVVPAALTPQLANNRLLVFYKVSVETAGFPVRMLSFREGAVATTTLAVFDLEGLASAVKPDGYFTEPVIYDPQKVLNIVVEARIATAVQARVRLGCFVIEPGGSVISP